MNKVKCIEIEVAIMRAFDFRRNLIVPNISSMMGIVPFETDMLILNKNNYATGFEIKVSKSDLKADFKKSQHLNINKMYGGKTGMQRWFGKFKYFNYAVPENLTDAALELIPDFCGLWVYVSDETYPYLKEVRRPDFLFNYKWSDTEKYAVARLGAMRVFNLKNNLINYQNDKKRH